MQILRFTVAPQAPALIYHGDGDCVWKIKNKRSGSEIKTRSDSHKLELENTSPIDIQLQAECIVNGTMLLDITINTIVSVPAPENVTLDTDNKILQWNHIFQPSDLPPDFELVHNYNITYLVRVSDKDTVTSVSVPGNRSYLNLDDEPVVLNGCEEQEFVVQAVINNEFYSENGSVVSGNFSVAPAFASFSAVAVVGNVFAIRVLFELTQEPCPGMNLSQFTVIFQELGSFVFDVTSTHIENGSAEFILPLNVSDPLMDVCSLRGVIFGGNDVGNSTATKIQPPTDCPPSSQTSPSSSTTMASTRSMVPSPTPTSPTVTSSTKSSKGVPPAIIAAVVVVLVVVGLVVLIIIAIIFLVKKNKVPKLGPSSEYRSVAEYRSTLADSAGREENPKGSNYTDVMTVKMPDEKIPAVSDDKSVYTTVDHVKTEKRRLENEAARAAHPESDSKPNEISTDPKDVGLSLQLHLQPLLEVLQPVKAVWYKLGMHLNLSENFLDETETNIETNEEYLSDILKNWLQYHESSMEMLNHALSKIDWQPITFDATIKGFVFVSGREEEGKGEGEGEERPAIPERNF